MSAQDAADALTLLAKDAASMGIVELGNWLLVGCCAVYLIWWCIGFNPYRKFPYWLQVTLFLATLGLGIAGVAVVQTGLAWFGELRPLGWYGLSVLVGAIGAYFLLLWITRSLFHRSPTTELILIVAWAAYETYIMVAFVLADTMRQEMFWGLFTFIVACALAGLVAYLRYYDEPPARRFVLGMVPLVIFAVAMAVVNFGIQFGWEEMVRAVTAAASA